jgi:hypothetical protein
MIPHDKLARRWQGLIVVTAMLLTVASYAVAQAERIDARARGTSTQMGRDFDVKITINQYSTAADRETLKNAFQAGGHDALVKALSKMKGVGRLSLPATTGVSIAYAVAIPTPTGRKIRFVTDRPVTIGEQRNMTRSEQYDLTAGEIEINTQDKDKSAGVLYPSVKVSLNKNGQIQFDLFQNPWQLTNIMDWTPKAK